MAKAVHKITLDRSEDIPFDKLELSQQNVRNIKAGVSIEDLADDIARRKLLQSLSVRPILGENEEETGRFHVPAGGRRYRALELLVSQKRMAKTEPVPCIVKRGEETSAEDDSLAENVHRVDLHPLDQYRAFQTLREQGLGEEEIAARFFVSVATVRQRLRLASVSPRLLDLYAEDEMKLEQIMAFSITNDHVRQEQVWDMLSRHHTRDPYYVRRLLTETTIRAGDRRAVYVSVKAYEAAGGVVMRDLFDEDNGGWLQDPALLEQLGIEKLRADAEALKTEEGWKWVESAFDFPYGHTSGLRRFYGELREFTEEELARHDALKAEYDELDADYADAESYCEEIERRLEELGNELDQLNDRPFVFDPDEVARGGAFISLAANGELKVERGFVRPEDEPQVKTEGDDPGDADGDIGKAADASSSAAGISVNGKPVSDDQPEEEDDTLRPLSDRLVIDLTATRTVALRNALASDPVIAFVAVLHAFVLKIFYLYGSETCLELTLQSAKFSQTQGLGDTLWAKEIDQRQEAWGQDLPKKPEELWDYLVALDDGSRQALFAHCASLSVNVVIEPWNKRTRAIANAKQVARSIGFDMVTAGWVPTFDNYLGRVTKAHILQAVGEAKGEQSAQLIDHLKKQDMAREAERLLDGRGWLPEPLRIIGTETGSEDVSPAADEAGDDPALEVNVGDLPAFPADAADLSDPHQEAHDDDGYSHLDAAE
ncbi:ParB/RepB/Spo0J family partition protein [Rhizobium leguminosarum]|uniref:ParB/RepB/Spo0J family partition protein n=1 Tax=Rhizobium leguminosarum TaxID=384 RepID=A0A4Q8XSM6_RHILE|nr:ParB/RepB/Spo0J family partition protein [Rhizobium leguminosarum]TAV43627.1 ParB/RepB/Spo0J family partition protein [Rhizobium leguminosarum]TAV82674.1 ParB/RepB/Spo0J family partition protein [Rhizobium leguminosarum]TAV83509.1 ParB/RepB/Spo0J family partition protein [Rhizobium leguminosarum]TAW14070.1 ParB/RepB/Spo0J family partition protein [Rhizobium leguminosarum]TAW26283.1 ParB/RepB/Spo0J family partition protein [Rhizobium leguminosarum]